ncbi:MAG: aspartyl/asparaginyl beta-hydroxylase domain-containing protein [Myxococcota bacterium]
MNARDVNPLMDRLAERLGQRTGLERVEDALRTLGGGPAAAPTVDHHEPTRLFFPGLTARPWHDRDAFAWVPAVERATAEIRSELGRLLAGQTPFFPYEDPYTLELGWRGWDTVTLVRKGKLHPENAAACPRTVAVLERTPMAVRQGMFSRLKPGAHLEPHTGGVNVVLTCHLPLIVPAGCGLRVGSETRCWREGEVTVFDDGFVHEAWNRGDAERVVLLWDIWHPDLSEVEVAALRLLFPRIDRMLRALAA